jgi:ribulose-phosphate 3-epimerase
MTSISPVLIAPSILSADLAHLGDEVRAVEAAGADWIHVDVMDGRFVPNITFGMPVLKSVRKVTKLPLDVHLMIVEPERYIEAFAEAGADHITVQLEACIHLDRVLASIRDVGCRAGVALNPATPLDGLRYVMHRLDQVMIMTVNPGYGGQSFMPEVVPKISRMRQLINDSGKAIDIVIDGGVKPGTIEQVVEAGANVAVAGSAIFSASPDAYASKIGALRQAVSS